MPVAEVVGVGDKASVLTAPMAMLGAGRGNRDAEVAEAARTFPDPMTSVVVASAGEVVVGAPAADEPVVPLTVRRMVKKARETSEVRAKVAVAGEARVVRKTTTTTKRITEMKSTATMVRVSMAQSTTAKVEATKRKEKEKEKVALLQGPLGSTVVAGMAMALGPEKQSAMAQNMTRKERLRAASEEAAVDPVTTRITHRWTA